MSDLKIQGQGPSPHPRSWRPCQ